MSLLKFLQSLRGHIQGNVESKVFVLGNSSADYDSIFGSILYAFFMTNSLKTLFLPLIDCREQDMPLRFQVSMVLHKIGIKPSDLLYTNMFPDLYSANNSFLLYDHNVRKQVPEQSLVEIIDHHAIDREIKQGQQNPSSGFKEIACPNLILHCGSALTLINFLYHPQLLDQAGNEEFCARVKGFLEKTGKKKITCEPIIDELILYGVLLDSYNFDKNQQDRWIDMDRLAHDSIIKSLPQDQKIYNYQDLSKAKTDVDRNLALTLTQQKDKDFKQISYSCGQSTIKINYSTILLDVKLFIDKYMAELSDSYSRQKIAKGEIHSFMFAFEREDAPGKLQKFKLFNGRDQADIKVLEDALSKEGNFKKVEDMGEWKLWEDPTGKTSRKKFDAYLKDYLRERSCL